jgi:GT2 family glycosyltransferase
MPASAARITVVFLLYRCAGEVTELVQALANQRHPKHLRQEDWMEALFMDDASGDGTAEAVRAALAQLGSPPHYRLAVNDRNLGLAGTMNRAITLINTPFVLTCHLDVRFGRHDYVAAMLDLLERHPRAAAITGQPMPRAFAGMPFAEKLNLVANLMDIFPARSETELVDVGFAEGRCDGFRVEALKAVGLWETTLRTAGEDQVLAARLRGTGSGVYQAPGLVYRLSVSGEQDSVARLMRHERLFGRVHPYILLKTPGARAGVTGPLAGASRRKRALLRLSQLGATGSYLVALALLTAGAPPLAWAAPLLAVLLAKLALFSSHLRAVPFSPVEHLKFWAVQPFLDVAYTVGLAEGLARLRGTAPSSPIV